MKVKMVLPALTVEKLEPMWDWIIRAKRAAQMLPVLEKVLSGFGAHTPQESLPSVPEPRAKPIAVEV